MTLQRVDVGELALESYRGIAPDEQLDALRERTAGLRGLRVLQLNATAYGGGVSELLASMVPLLRDLGIEAEWRTIRADTRFFDVTKKLHNALQGAAVSLTEEERALYMGTSQLNAQALTEEFDVVVVHDPQPAAIPSIHGRGDARWIWRCHIDTSAPNPDAYAFLAPFLASYDAAEFTLHEFVPADFPIRRVAIVPPAIDPLSPKNLPLPDSLARQVLNWIGIRLDRPLVTQVARFDPWKDPLGVIAAWRIARTEVPNLQLALVGSMALDDPEAWEVYRAIDAERRSDPLLHVFTNLTGVGNIEVNAFQRLSDVIVQKSIREGFGLVVSEAMWKGTPVVAGRAGGIPLQVADGEGGILVDGIDECAEAIVTLLQDAERAAELGRRGRERVRTRFLLPRLLLDEVALIEEVVSDAAGTPGPAVSPSGSPGAGEPADERTADSGAPPRAPGRPARS